VSPPPPEEWKHLKIDLLRRLMNRPPDSGDEVSVASIEGWFSKKEQDTARELVRELVTEDPIPVTYSTEAREQVKIGDEERMREFVELLREP